MGCGGIAGIVSPRPVKAVAVICQPWVTVATAKMS